MQRILIDSNDQTVNRMITEGWFVISVTATEGKFCFVLKK